jgi:hypothetical protein
VAFASVRLLYLVFYGEQTEFFKGRSPIVQNTHEKMHTILGHKGKANQNHTKIPPHSCYNSYHQKHHQQQMLARMQGKRNPHTLLLGM